MCIARTFVATMQVKLNIQPCINGEPAPPKLSTQQLLDLQKKIKDPTKLAIRRMLSWVKRNWIVVTLDYDPSTQQTDLVWSKFARIVHTGLQEPWKSLLA